MQTLVRAFLAIYLAHLLADFVFQPHRLVEQKRRGNPAAYLLHGLIHYLSAALIAVSSCAVPSSRHARNWSSSR